MTKSNEMSPMRYAVVLAMADCNMRAIDAAEKLGIDHSTIIYHCKIIKKITGKDPRNFYDLVELVCLVKGEEI